MESVIPKLSNHIIVCGYGRLGKQVSKELQLVKETFVVIENDSEAIGQLYEEHILYVEGSAVEDKMLLQAGVKSARGLIASLRQDTDNLYVTLSAKKLNPNLEIISRAEEEYTASKLQDVGANHVVYPYRIGGHRMVHLLVHKAAVEFYDSIVRDVEVDLKMGQVLIQEGSLLNGMLLKQSRIREKAGLMVIAIKPRDGKIQVNPSGNTKLFSNDLLIVVGKIEGLQTLNDMAAATG